MNVRPAQARDAERIARLHAISWRSAYRGMLSDVYLDGDIVADREALWSERLATPAANQYVAVAEAHNELVGFACAFGAHETPWGTLLENLHVAPMLKRSGIGSRLLQDVARWTRHHHPEVGMHLWVLQANTAAQAFYRTTGAQEVGQACWSAPDGSEIPQLRYAWLKA
jgi:GNAT superfamily N-acetyltransferase